VFGPIFFQEGVGDCVALVENIKMGEILNWSTKNIYLSLANYVLIQQQCRKVLSHKPIFRAILSRRLSSNQPLEHLHSSTLMV